MAPKVYLANCLGFCTLLRDTALEAVVQALEVAGWEVIEPFLTYNPVESVSEQNCRKIGNCSMMVAIIDGSGKDVDSGIAAELYEAKWRGVPVVVLDTRYIEKVSMNEQLLGLHILHRCETLPELQAYMTKKAKLYAR